MSSSFRRLSSLLAAGSAPAPVSVVRSARAGFAPWASYCAGVSFRPSARSFSRFVAVVRFTTAAAAYSFARSWGDRFEVGARVGFCAVRCWRGSWCVSVPVSPASPAPRRGAFGPRVARAVSLRLGLSA